MYVCMYVYVYNMNIIMYYMYAHYVIGILQTYSPCIIASYFICLYIGLSFKVLPASNSYS